MHRAPLQLRVRHLPLHANLSGTTKGLRYSRVSRASDRCDPMKPAPPVIRQRMPDHPAAVVVIAFSPQHRRSFVHGNLQRTERPVCRRIAHPEVVDRIHDATAEQLRPDPVDHHPGELPVPSRSEPIRQYRAAVLIPRDRRRRAAHGSGGGVAAASTEGARDKGD